MQREGVSNISGKKLPASLPSKMNPHAKRCTAHTKATGDRCRNMAVTGRTVCRLHGGKAGRPPTHGLYALEHQTKLAELHKDLMKLEDPLDLRPELGMLRALVQDWIDRYDQTREALLLWSQSFENPRPITIHDVSEGWKILEAISRVVERIEKARSQNAISRPDLVRVMQEMGRVVERHVRDPETLERIRDGWLNNIRV